MRSAILALCVLLTGCAGEIDRVALEDLPVQHTTRWGFAYAVAHDIGADTATMGDILDDEFTGWLACMGAHEQEVNANPAIAQAFRYIIVPHEFQCAYHPLYCGGEYHRNPPRIILAYETPRGAPIPTAWHEWSDIYKPSTEDESGRPCTHGI